MAQQTAREGRGRDPLLDRPELDPALSHVWRGFQQLDAGRTWHDGAPRPIRTEAILAWLEILGHVDLEEREQLLDLLLGMDAHFLSWQRQERADGQRSLPPGDEC